jgi:hypothetical protein
MVLEQGATFNLVVTWRNPDQTPINLLGYSAKMQVRPSKGSTDVIATFSTDDDTIVLGGNLGTIMFDVAPEATAQLPAGVYVYDLEMRSSGGQVTRLLEGAFTIDAEVTR